MKKQEFIKKILSVSQEYKMKIDREKALVLYAYYRELFTWNKRINLISKREEDRFIERHIIDSLLVIKKLRIKEGDKLLDIGSGNGLPGVVLAIMLNKAVVDLLESKTKKCVFLRHIKSKLSLGNIYLFCERFEKIYREIGKYDIILVRGKRISEKEKEMIMQILRRHGSLIIYSGKKPTISLLNPGDVMECFRGVEGRKILRICRF